ncbi:7884_t:CDS:2, partial [Acaulospora morrowiae]
YEGFLTKGYIYKWNVEEKKWDRKGEKKVALKKSNSEQTNEEFFEEAKRHNEFYIDDHSLMRCYGITKDPTSNKFMIVTTFAELGTLSEYLKNHFGRLIWAWKFKILSSIAKGIRHIHENNYKHKDLHGKNIVMYEEYYPLIIDFGNPFEEYSHYSSKSLAIKIISGTRPKISEKIPDYIKKLIKKCWVENPDDRPSAQDLYEDLYKLRESLENGKFNNYDDNGDDFSKCINECIDYDNKIKSLSKNANPSSTDDSGQESKPYSVDKESVMLTDSRQQYLYISDYFDTTKMTLNQQEGLNLDNGKKMIDTEESKP